ncbi:MAG: FAD-dependent monooxygenase, partial [Variovorax sp.]
ADVPPALLRRIEGVRLYAPNMRQLDLHAPGYYFWATDTPALLDWLAASLAPMGVAVRTGSLFERAEPLSHGWRVVLQDGSQLEAGYLVGADGPHSRVAKALRLSCNTQFLFGVEHEYAEARLAPDMLHCFVDQRLAPGYIGWALQGVGASQIGVARRQRPRDGHPLRLAPLLEKIAPVVAIGDAPPLSIRAGMIPCGGTLPHVARSRALLVGDAAGMVSPVTAGGIRTALEHGERAGAAVARFIRRESDDPAIAVAAGYPRFGLKRALRWGFDRLQNDWLVDRLLGTRAMRRAAERIYFHRKGDGA